MLARPAMPLVVEPTATRASLRQPAALQENGLDITGLLEKYVDQGAAARHRMHRHLITHEFAGAFGGVVDQLFPNLTRGIQAGECVRWASSPGSRMDGVHEGSPRCPARASEAAYRSRVSRGSASPTATITGWIVVSSMTIPLCGSLPVFDPVHPARRAEVPTPGGRRARRWTQSKVRTAAPVTRPCARSKQGHGPLPRMDRDAPCRTHVQGGGHSKQFRRRRPGCWR